MSKKGMDFMIGNTMLAGLTEWADRASLEELRQGNSILLDMIKAKRQVASKTAMRSLKVGGEVQFETKGQKYRAKVVRKKSTKVVVEVTEAPSAGRVRFPVGSMVDAPASMLESVS